MTNESCQIVYCIRVCDHKYYHQLQIMLYELQYLFGVSAVFSPAVALQLFPCWCNFNCSTDKLRIYHSFWVMKTSKIRMVSLDKLSERSPNRQTVDNICNEAVQVSDQNKTIQQKKRRDWFGWCAVNLNDKLNLWHGLFYSMLTICPELAK